MSRPKQKVAVIGLGYVGLPLAALCAKKNCGTRELRYNDLRATLVKGGVYFES